MSEPNRYIETRLNLNMLYSNLNEEKGCLATKYYKQVIRGVASASGKGTIITPTFYEHKSNSLLVTEKNKPKTKKLSFSIYLLIISVLIVTIAVFVQAFLIINEKLLVDLLPLRFPLFICLSSISVFSLIAIAKKGGAKHE